MKMKYIIVVLAVILTSCIQSSKKNEIKDFDSVDLSEKENVLAEMDTVGEGIPIFYNMYLSVELSSLFEAAGVIFDKELLNPSDKAGEYSTSYKKAMNLGVYAVDLSYCRSFEQFEVAGRYFSSMQKISEQLGIPQKYFESVSQRFENNLTNRDSLIAIANEIYYETEEYLKENERFATASVIIMGGWVEAIYIGTFVAMESRNPDIIERLVDQKYSLNNLLLLLSKYEDNEMISKYIAELKKLRLSFDALNVKIPTGFVATGEDAQESISIWLKEIEKLQKGIKATRTKIIE